MHIDEFLGQSREYLFKVQEESAESCERRVEASEPQDTSS